MAVPKQMDMPDSIREHLLISSKGTRRLLKIIDRLLADLPQMEEERAQGVIRLISDLALAAWEQSPFDLVACSTLLQVHEQVPFLPPEVAGAVRRGAVPPQCGAKTLEALDAVFTHSREPEEISDFLDSTRNEEPNSLFWMHYADRFAYAGNCFDWFSDFLAGQKGMPPYLRRISQGDVFLAQRQWDAAWEKYEEASGKFESPGLMIKKAEALYNAGHRAEATALWQRAFAVRPWDFSLALRLGDILQERDLPGEEPQGQGAVFLYSWNHAEDLNVALSGLVAATPSHIPILLLDNGSTDDTAALCQRWMSELGGRLSIITMPVNIGAPAARNWLLSTPAGKQSDWLIFLDDDALVPPKWLNYFGKTMQQYPQSGIFGCRVNDMSAPQLIQSADLHYEQPLFPASEEKTGLYFRMADFHAHVPDRGEHGYMRSCVSVTGCCHLITRRSLDAVGHFNLLFSPSQFDDYERDVRSGVDGVLPVYNGHIMVRHKKRSGRIKTISRQTAANVNGNSLKAMQLYSDNQMESLLRLDVASMTAHLDTCLEVIAMAACRSNP
jgi:GT2 family glycosyltransferase